jgi:hypothetical protein
MKLIDKNASTTNTKMRAKHAKNCTAMNQALNVRKKVVNSTQMNLK